MEWESKILNLSKTHLHRVLGWFSKYFLEAHVVSTFFRFSEIPRFSSFDRSKTKFSPIFRENEEQSSHSQLPPLHPSQHRRIRHIHHIYTYYLIKSWFVPSLHIQTHQNFSFVSTKKSCLALDGRAHTTNNNKHYLFKRKEKRKQYGYETVHLKKTETTTSSTV